MGHCTSSQREVYIPVILLVYSGIQNADLDLTLSFETHGTEEKLMVLTGKISFVRLRKDFGSP